MFNIFHNSLKNQNIIKNQRENTDNFLTLRSIHFNIKTKSTVLKPVNQSSLCLTCVRRRQRM